MGSATVYMHAEMARERQQGLLAEAAAQREAERAQLYGRIFRQAERAERRDDVEITRDSTSPPVRRCLLVSSASSRYN